MSGVAATLLIALVPAALAVSAGPEIGLTSVTGLNAALHDEVHSYELHGKPHLRWQTFWSLSWAPVAGATHYEIRYKTSEGTSQKVRVVDQPLFRLEVAKGDNPKAQGLLARQVQLDTLGSLLSAQVQARGAGGDVGAPSRWLQVGQPLPAKP